MGGQRLWNRDVLVGPRLWHQHAADDFFHVGVVAADFPVQQTTDLRSQITNANETFQHVLGHDVRVPEREVGGGAQKEVSDVC